MYQNDHLKQKSKFLHIQSLVLENKIISSKTDTFISVLSYLIQNIQAGLNIPR